MKNKCDLQNAQTTVDAMNQKIKGYGENFPPEALQELEQLRDSFEQMEAGNQNHVYETKMDKFYNMAEKWYGDESLYAQMMQAQAQGEHAQVLALADAFLEKDAPELVATWYGAVMAESTLSCTKRQNRKTERSW